MSGSGGESKPGTGGAQGSLFGGGMAGIPSGEPGGWLTMKRRGSGPEWFRQMQLDMLCKENANLASKLDSLTMDLRSRADKSADDSPSTRSTLSGVAEGGLYSRPEKVMKSPRVRELSLHFAGDSDTFDRAAISAKLLHIKRLLHRRIDFGLSPQRHAAGSLLHALCALHECPPGEKAARVQVVSTAACSPEQQRTLSTELAALLSFTLSAHFDEDDVAFRVLEGEGVAAHAALSLPPASIDDRPSSPDVPHVVLLGVNDGNQWGTNISEAALAEAAQGESASWDESFGAGVRVAWVLRDAAALEKNEGTVVCSSEDNGALTALYYPSHLQAFFAERSASNTTDARTFLHTVLGDQLDGMAFQEWKTTVRKGVSEVVVPVVVPEWVATTVLELARAGDPWLSFLTTPPHPLLLVSVARRDERPAEASEIKQGESPSSGATAASIKLFFELERQQELIRRKIASLERLMQCKQFVSHMESFTARLQSHAEELFSGIRIKQETPNTLDALCSQLSSLSMQCEACIHQAMDAVQAVGEAPVGEEFILQQQLTKIVHARSAKRHVDSLKNQVEGALAEKRSNGVSKSTGDFDGDSSPLSLSASSGAASGAAATSPPASPLAGLAISAGAAGGRAASGGERAAGAAGGGPMDEEQQTSTYTADRRGGLEMLDNIEKGLQVHKSQQEQLVDFWLRQHAIVKSELSSLLTMASAAFNAEDIGVEELQGRFQKYCEFLEEHEQVEDKMLFPLVKSLFPQSAHALESVLDPERHKGVDQLNAKVGRLLQQLHDRHRAGEEMVLNTREMGKVVEALERLNDFMVGHIRYEEEMTMPWFEIDQNPWLDSLRRPLVS
mmetsp:Transcript_6127/g.14114  ORF Transcript_6127/g.14114 Transcript_6127/m.14114 type:complete len:845 (+) Transcript_6127:103-2637(+)